MIKDLIRAASRPSSAGYFTTAVVFAGLTALTRSPIIAIIGGCFLVGGLMMTLSNWANESPDEDPDAERSFKNPTGEKLSKKVTEEIKAYTLLAARAKALREPLIVKELDALGVLSRRLEALGSIDPADIGDKVKQIYAASFGSLQRCVELAEAQQQMQTPEIRARVAMARQKLVIDVSESLRLLERTVDELQVARLDPDSSGKSLVQLRGELDQSLSIARRIDERMKDLIDEDEYLRAAERASR